MGYPTEHDLVPFSGDDLPMISPQAVERFAVSGEIGHLAPAIKRADAEGRIAIFSTTLDALARRLEGSSQPHLNHCIVQLITLDPHPDSEHVAEGLVRLVESEDPETARLGVELSGSISSLSMIKLGMPDIEWCGAERFVAYLNSSVYDLQHRRSLNRIQKLDVEITRDQLTFLLDCLSERSEEDHTFAQNVFVQLAEQHPKSLHDILAIVENNDDFEDLMESWGTENINNFHVYYEDFGLEEYRDDNETE